MACREETNPSGSIRRLSVRSLRPLRTRRNTPHMGMVRRPVFSVEKSLGRTGPGSSSAGRSRAVRARARANPIRRTARATAARLPGMGRPVSASKPVWFCSSRSTQAAAPPSAAVKGSA